VDPFSGVIVIKGRLITYANGWNGCAKSASEWTGWDMGGFSAVGGIAELPEQNVHFGRGPNADEVI
jgi:hypothetical protein